MRILLGIHQFFPLSRGGTEVLTLELARGLLARGHDVAIVAAARDEQRFANECWLVTEQFDEISVFRVVYGIAGRKNPFELHEQASHRLQTLKRAVELFSPDIVHFQHLHGFSAEAIPLIAALGMVVCFSATDFWVVCPRATLYQPSRHQVCSGPDSPGKCLHCYVPKIPAQVGRLLAGVAKTEWGERLQVLAPVRSLENRSAAVVRKVNGAHRIYCSTRFLANILESAGIDKSILSVKPYGVRIGQLPVHVDLPSSFTTNQPLIIGFMGSLIEQKGAHVLIDALAKMEGECKSRVEVHIYGAPDREGGQYQTDLQRSADDSGGRILFQGTFPHEQIGKVLRSLHIMVVPSVWYESAPLVLCSALSAGVPVLVSDLGGMSEVVRDGINGQVFPAGDSRALSENLAELSRNPDAIRKMRGPDGPYWKSIGDYVEEMEAEYAELLIRQSKSMNLISSGITKRA